MPRVIKPSFRTSWALFLKISTILHHSPHLERSLSAIAQLRFRFLNCPPWFYAQSLRFKSLILYRLGVRKVRKYQILDFRFLLSSWREFSRLCVIRTGFQVFWRGFLRKCGVVEVDVVMMFGRSFSRRGFVGRIATPSSCRLNFFGRCRRWLKVFLAGLRFYWVPLSSLALVSS
jgi:hypothetical protein